MSQKQTTFQGESLSVLNIPMGGRHTSRIDKVKELITLFAKGEKQIGWVHPIYIRADTLYYGWKKTQKPIIKKFMPEKIAVFNSESIRYTEVKYPLRYLIRTLKNSGFIIIQVPEISDLDSILMNAKFKQSEIKESLKRAELSKQLIQEKRKLKTLDKLIKTHINANERVTKFIRCIKKERDTGVLNKLIHIWEETQLTLPIVYQKDILEIRELIKPLLQEADKYISILKEMRGECPKKTKKRYART